ncbi:PapI protein [Escherichia coli]|nr:PapI protein [Escherichia coli]KAA2073391.1 PapI protein [Escherichia coli]MBB0679043.1 PapI protein [Escherichia coli]MDI4342907.1 PapI protein [Escherichia coli]PQV30847.1 PapI protein [Escherichia coli]
MLPSETMIWQPEFTDKTLSRKPGAVHFTKRSWRLMGSISSQTAIFNFYP